MSSRPSARAPAMLSTSCAHRLLPVGEQRKQIERPGERLRGGLMPRHQKGHDIVDDESVWHGLARGGVSCRHESAEQVVALAPRSFARLPERASAMPRIVRPSRVMTREPGCGIHGGKRS